MREWVLVARVRKWVLLVHFSKFVHSSPKGVEGHLGWVPLVEGEVGGDGKGRSPAPHEASLDGALKRPVIKKGQESSESEFASVLVKNDVVLTCVSVPPLGVLLETGNKAGSSGGCESLAGTCWAEENINVRSATDYLVLDRHIQLATGGVFDDAFGAESLSRRESAFVKGLSESLQVGSASAGFTSPVVEHVAVFATVRDSAWEMVSRSDIKSR